MESSLGHRRSSSAAGAGAAGAAGAGAMVSFEWPDGPRKSPVFNPGKDLTEAAMFQLAEEDEKRQSAELSESPACRDSQETEDSAKEINETDETPTSHASNRLTTNERRGTKIMKPARQDSYEQLSDIKAFVLLYILMCCGFPLAYTCIHKPLQLLGLRDPQLG